MKAFVEHTCRAAIFSLDETAAETVYSPDGETYTVPGYGYMRGQLFRYFFSDISIYRKELAIILAYFAGGNIEKNEKGPFYGRKGPFLRAKKSGTTVFSQNHSSFSSLVMSPRTASFGATPL
jgi:hypothetical protein